MVLEINQNSYMEIVKSNGILKAMFLHTASKLAIPNEPMVPMIRIPMRASAPRA